MAIFAIEAVVALEKAVSSTLQHFPCKRRKVFVVSKEKEKQTATVEEVKKGKRGEEQGKRRNTEKERQTTTNEKSPFTASYYPFSVTNGCPHVRRDVVWKLSSQILGYLEELHHLSLERCARVTAPSSLGLWARQ